MGVQGLLQELRGITRRVGLSEFQGETAAIDAFCWLHRGGGGIEAVRFCMKMIDVLAFHSIRPILVFDGMPLLVKEACDESREQNRIRNRELAAAAESSGDTHRANALMRRAVSITPAVVHALLQQLRLRRVDFLVAPFEADPQLAQLSRLNLCDLVISEDSDCLVYGCKRVLFKLGADGVGDLIERKDLGANAPLSFASWRDDQFRLFCCLSGCDYAPRVHGVGIRTSHKLLAKHKDPSAALAHLVRHLRLDALAATSLIRAFLTYKHQSVWDPVQQRLAPLCDIDEELVRALFEACHLSVDLRFLGTSLGHADTLLLVEGLLDPSTGQPYLSRDSRAEDATVPEIPREAANAVSVPPEVKQYPGPAPPLLRLSSRRVELQNALRPGAGDDPGVETLLHKRHREQLEDKPIRHHDVAALAINTAFASPAADHFLALPNFSSIRSPAPLRDTSYWDKRLLGC